MNLFKGIGSFIKKHRVIMMATVFVSIFSSLINAGCSIFLSPFAKTSEVIANRIEKLSQNDPLKRSNIAIDDESGLLYSNYYHVEMMSYIGRNNSIFSKDDQNVKIIYGDEGNSISSKVSAYGITSCGNGYVYGQTTIPYGIEIIKGSYSPVDAIYDEEQHSDVGRGCIISESLAKKVFQDQDPISRTITISSFGRQTSFIVSAVARDSCLCNDYASESNFVMTNYYFYKPIMSGHCQLVFRLKNDYYTNQSIFQRLFTKVYLKGYSTDKLTIHTGDNYLDDYITRFVDEGYRYSSVAYLSYLSLLLQIGLAVLFSSMIKRQKCNPSFIFCAAVLFLLLSFSFIFADLINNIPAMLSIYSSRSTMTTAYLLLGITVFMVSFVWTQFFSVKKDGGKNNHRNYIQIDV